SAVAFIIDRAGVEKAGYLLGVTPDDFVTSASGDYSGLFAFRTSTTSDAQLVSAIRSAVAERAGDRAGEVAIAGPAAFHVLLDDYSQRRMPLVMLCITLLGLLLLRWVSGSWRVAAAGVAAILISQVILLGTIAWQ